jgi:translation initiation factor IF-2
MEDALGNSLKEATFSSPVRLVGFDELPAVGSEFHTYASKRDAEDARTNDPSLVRTPDVTQEEDTPDVFSLPVILRADTTGSLDAIQFEAAKIGDNHRKIRIVQCGIGAITEDDIKNSLASLMKDGAPAPVLGFHVGVEPIAKAFSLERGVSIEQFDIIYKLTERFHELLATHAPKRTVERVVGSAKVLKYFSSKHDEHVIGARVQGGELRKKGVMRIVRRDQVIGRGTIENLQHNKQNVEKVQTEGEFGAVIASETQPSPGDTVECIEISEE